MRNALKDALKITDDSQLTISALKSYNGTLTLNNKKLTDLSALNYLESITSLTMSSCGITQKMFNQIDFSNFKIIF